MNDVTLDLTNPAGKRCSLAGFSIFNFSRSAKNVSPRITADIYDKFIAGDLAGALDAQFTLAPLRIACSMGTFPAVIKEGLVQEGYAVGKCLSPISELKPEEKKKLHQVLSDMKLV